MSIFQIDKILAAYERTGLCHGIPHERRIAATAQALDRAEEVA